MTPPLSDKPGLWAWARNPKAGGAATIAAVLLSVMLVGLEMALGRSGRGLDLEDMPGFYAATGLAGAVLILACGIVLRAVLVRPNDVPAPTDQDGGGDDRQP
jgi:hypothetical protein